MAALESRAVLSVDLPLAMRQAWLCVFHAAIGVLDEPVINIRGAMQVDDMQSQSLTSTSDTAS
jgi:hypothetical protein